MRIAFVGHKYHQTTRSADFFVKLLETVGQVDVYYDDSLDGSVAVDLNAVKSGYDLVVAWQIEYIVPILIRKGVAPLVFVPMYDGCMGLPDAYWRSLGNTKIVCFSARLYEKLQRLKRNCIYARYCVGVEKHRRTPVGRGLGGFYWYRRSILPPDKLDRMVQTLGLQSLVIEYAPDPSERMVFSRDDFTNAIGVPVMFRDWTDSRRNYLVGVAKAHVYFAPRAHEGIGMSFLEAMAMGMVVVAPDNPTMNEYIIHGYNGVLYRLDDYELLDINIDFEKVSRNAIATIYAGAEQWGKFTGFLLSWLTSDMQKSSFFFDETRIRSGALPASMGTAERNSRGGRRPTVTVATVVKDAIDDVGDTIQSVLSQTYSEKEYIVLDGDSVDGTKHVVERYLDRIDRYRSEPDRGTYDAMNKAAAMATGEWLIFMNAGDRFLSEYSLEDFLSDVPRDAEFVVGHHIYQRAEGGYELHSVNDFDVSYRRLVEGKLDGNWMRGIPGHQATATKRRLLATEQYDLRYRIAADHELMYRCKRKGARFFLSDCYVSMYCGDGASWANAVRCTDEWRRIALEYTKNPRAVHRFYDSVLMHQHLEKLKNMALFSAIKYIGENPEAAWLLFGVRKTTRYIFRRMYNWVAYHKG
jgi:glycosyltransferase involved in cell wall biosynthesis